MKEEILKNYRIDKLDDKTVFISNKHFFFAYTVADSIVKEEFRGQYRYFGGLQCNYPKGSYEFAQLEDWLCELVEKITLK